MTATIEFDTRPTPPYWHTPHFDVHPLILTRELQQSLDDAPYGHRGICLELLESAWDSARRNDGPAGTLLEGSLPVEDLGFAEAIGFVEHTNGYLYHPELTRQVLAILKIREDAAKRSRDYRRRLKAKRSQKCAA